jgi:small subunit ribosomal protein S20
MPMPVIKSAKKKLRKDRKKELQNKTLRILFKKSVKLAQKSPTESNLRQAVKITDKIAKKGIIHQNKAARIKSKLAKLLKNKKPVAKPTLKAKKPVEKQPSKTKAKK